MNKFGFNIQMPGAGLDLIERYKPVAALLMDVKSEHVAEANRLSPETEIIFRKEDGKGWRDKDPVEWAKAMWADVSKCPPDFVVADNEPLGHDHAAEFAALDNWQYDFTGWIHDNTPMCVGLFSFPEGNFTRDGPIIPDHFPRSMSAADAVFIHEYWKPHLLSPGMEGYHCLRWDAWLKWFEEAGFPNMPIYVTECGITMAVDSPVYGGGPDVGYASERAKVIGITAETYLADLDEYHRRCCAEPRIKAVLPFIWRTWPGEWGSFVPTPEMTRRMFLFDAPGPPPEPEPDGGEEMEEVKVFDMEGNPQTLDWAEKKYGVAFRRAEVAAGQKVYRLVELREKTGNSSLITKVVDESDAPVANVDVAFYWPDAPDPPDPPTVVYPHDWYRNFVHGSTNENGDHGPGMGPGAYHGRGEGGPHAVWVRDSDIPGDICEKLGMLAGTPHDHLDQKFKLMIAGGEPEPSDELEVKEYLEEPWPSNMLCIAWPVKEAYSADVHATSDVSDDEDTSPLEKWKYQDKEYAMGGVCTSFTGGPSRIYRIWAYRLPNPADRITPAAVYEFAPLNGAAKRIICVVDYAEPGPEPGPSPIDDIVGLAETIVDMAEAIIVRARSIEAGEPDVYLAYPGNRIVKYVPETVGSSIWARLIRKLLGR